MGEKQRLEWKENEIKNFLKNTEWRCTTDPKGRTYYYHKGTKKTQWNKPDELVEFEKTLDSKLSEDPLVKSNDDTDSNKPEPIVNDDASIVRQPEATSTTVTTGISGIKLPITVFSEKLSAKVQTLKNPFNISEESDEEEIEAPQTSSDNLMKAKPSDEAKLSSEDPSEKRWRFSPDERSEQSVEDREASKKRRMEDSTAVPIPSEESIFQAKDSFVNPVAIDLLMTRIKEHPEEEVDLIKQLISNYVGYYHMSRIVMEWLGYADHLIQQKSGGTEMAASLSFGSGERTTEELHQQKIKQLLCDILGNRFTRKAADSNKELLDLVQSPQPNWLSDLVGDAQVAETLKNLHQKYPESQFLRLCTEKTSEHRLIAPMDV